MYKYSPSLQEINSTEVKEQRTMWQAKREEFIGIEFWLLPTTTEI